MMIWVQSSLLNPDGGMAVDSKDFAGVSRAPLPDGILSVGHSHGWIHRLCVQGVEFIGDHYAVEQMDTTTVRVYVWNDDPRDYGPGLRFARVWTFRSLAPDPRLGGAINTCQSQIVYVDFGGPLHSVMVANGPIENTEFRDWSEFVPPDESIVRHGIWTPDVLNAEHETRFVRRNWREWTDGVPSGQIDSRGFVKLQRPQGRYNKPHGTITYYQRDTNLATGIHACLLETCENELNIVAGTGQTEVSGNLGGGTEGLLFCFTTQADNPNVADWPSGNYRFQLDVSGEGAGITFGAKTAGSTVGHIARVNAGLTADLQTWAMIEDLFSGTGLKFGSTGTIDPTSGNAGDRYEILIAGVRAASHGNEAVTLTFDADAYADGPWEAPVGGPTGHFMGFSF